MGKDKNIGLTVRKEENFSEWYTQLCSDRGAALADTRYGVKGCIVHRPWGFRILRSINELLEREVEADSHEPVLFPSVIPQENLEKEASHVDGFAPEVFWVTEGGGRQLEQRLALRPTGETAFYPMYSLWIQSYKDLPFKRYQSRITTFRYEMSTRPFLRGREFMFFETHNVFRSHDAAMAQIRKDMAMSRTVFWEKLAIPHVFFRRPSWDKFAGANDTYASDTLLPDGQRNQIGSTHDLGQRFARAFDVTFLDDDGAEKFGWQTCWGPGIWRIFAAVISIHGDDKGLRLPSILAPVQIAVIPIPTGRDDAQNEKVKSYSDEVTRACTSDVWRCSQDTSENSPGYKFNHWELMGVPLRIEVGSRETDRREVTIVPRTTGQKTVVSLDALDRAIPELLKRNDQELKEAAKAFFESATAIAETMEGLQEILETHCGFIRVPFCSITDQGKACADVLKDKARGTIVCGVPFENAESRPRDSLCIVCGKPSKELVYTARSY